MTINFTGFQGSITVFGDWGFLHNFAGKCFISNVVIRQGVGWHWVLGIIGDTPVIMDPSPDCRVPKACPYMRATVNGFGKVSGISIGQDRRGTLGHTTPSECLVFGDINCRNIITPAFKARVIYLNPVSPGRSD